MGTQLKTDLCSNYIVVRTRATPTELLSSQEGISGNELNNAELFATS